jgi:hypothetical protein
MRKLNRRFAMALPAFALALGVTVAAHGQQAEQAPRKDLVLKGDAKCTRCHDETEEYPVLAIGKTKHGTLADVRTPTCTSCHGESEIHVNKPVPVAPRPNDNAPTSSGRCCSGVGSDQLIRCSNLASTGRDESGFSTRTVIR